MLDDLANTCASNLSGAIGRRRCEIVTKDIRFFFIKAVSSALSKTHSIKVYCLFTLLPCMLIDVFEEGSIVKCYLESAIESGCWGRVVERGAPVAPEMFKNVETSVSLVYKLINKKML
jgi:hypothetical protein